MKIYHSNYQINPTRVIGQGGFGFVQAVDLYNNSGHRCGEYAIKIFSPADKEHEEELLPRFSREVRYQASCAHQNIVQVYMYNDKNKTPWFLMDLAECDLEHEIGNGLLLDLEKINIMKMTLRGVRYMHSRSLLHRDIKPRNILKFNSTDGPVYKISDFGLAKNIDSSKESDILTRIATALGTEKYMAPESKSAGEYSIKSDIYSLGVVFEDLNHTETSALRKIIDKCTQRRPNSRYDNVQAIYEDLAAIEVDIK
ncbi:serine/threonine-protein kinase [Xanthomonas arboricola]|uniref:serine/threonine-protein kinase n=1 Tax=Xanthomonas arboricola TaxID=56448 RepID=UPI000CC84CAD|nr:serine/threonine-protein kinase [Xanthomonas arboricola]SOU01055.1 protein kinase [Xanthomonas arboricola pv. fragariae]